MKEAFTLTDEMIMITNDEVNPQQTDVLFVNEAFTEVTGYETDDLQSLSMVQSRDVDPHTLTLYKEARRNKETFRGFILGEKKSGEYFWVDLTLTPYHDAKNDVWYFIHKPRLVSEYELIKDRAKLMGLSELTAEMARIGMWEYYPNTGKAFFSDSMYDILGLKQSEFQPRFDLYKDLIAKEDQASINRLLDEVRDSGEPGSLLHRIRKADSGAQRYLKAYARRYMTDHDHIKLYGIVQDITGEVNLRKKLEEAERKWEKLVQLNPDLIAMHKEGNIVFINKAGIEMFGLDDDSEIVGESVFELIHPEDHDMIKKRLKKLKRGEVMDYYTYRVEGPGGSFRYLRTKSLPIQHEGEQMVLTVGQDVTEQFRDQQRLKKLLEQKQVLIKEIHHRVKNNMAIVSGLLDLQKGTIQEPSAEAALTNSQLRLHTMAQIHEQLYREQDLTDITSNRYLENLLGRIRDLYSESRITVETHIDSFELNVNQATPLGLLLNELIINAYKHAFSSDEQGKITIRLWLEGDMVHAEVSDNGRGMPEQVDPEKPETLGFTIVETLKKQLNADIKMDTGDKGTTVSITFVREQPKGSASNIRENII